MGNVKAARGIVAEGIISRAGEPSKGLPPFLRANLHPHPSLPPLRGKGLVAAITPILTFPRRGGRDKVPPG